MAKVTLKKKVEAEQATALSEVKLYARKIWLAGLGAYAKAGSEGADYVKELIKTGEVAEREGKKVIGKKIEAANSEINSDIDDVKREVKGMKGKFEVQFEKVEHAFDRRVSRALNRFGIASKHDVETLSAKLDGLTALLERIARKQ